jgi:hypothetical protein
MFRYLGLPSLTDATFVMFLLSWLVTRQIGFFGVFLSVVFKAPKHLHWVWDPSQGLYVSDNLHLGIARGTFGHELHMVLYGLQRGISCCPWTRRGRHKK